MEQKGDFIGFRFANVPSSSLNIIRTSGGDRFNEQIIPEIKDITVEVPGRDGEYYYGTTYGRRTFEISIAYDNLTEEQFRTLRKVYGRKRIGELIFDERPYKKYLAKIESPIELSYICFDEPKKRVTGTRVGEERYGVRRDPTTETGWERVYPYEKLEGTERIYKGEGTLNFVSYFPFAKSCFKVLPTEYENSDWVVSSGILSRDEYQGIDIYDTETGIINVYNAGDVETGFRLYVPFNGTEAQAGVNLTYQSTDSNIAPAHLNMGMITPKPGDIGYVIDTNTGLINGVLEYEYTEDYNSIYITSGNLYNEYITSGYLFHLQPNVYSDEATIEIENGVEGIEIFYDYLYF